MRILHLSDLHVGKKINDISLLEDQIHVFRQALNIVNEKNIDLVIIAGDIFDKAIVSSDSLRMYSTFTEKLIFDYNVNIIAISGNHDSGSRLDYESLMKEKVGYYVFGEFKGYVEKITLEDQYGKIDFYPIPYIEPMRARAIYEDPSIRTYDEVYERIMEDIHIDGSRRNICIAHGFVTSHRVDNSEELKEKIDDRDKYQIINMVAGLEQVSEKHFSKFDYTALGHIHRSYPVDEDKTIGYCGSLIKTNFNEENQIKTFLIVDIDDKNISFEKIPVDLLRDMRVINGKLSEILEREDFDTSSIKVILEDSEPIPNAMDKLRIIFPNILQLNYSNLVSEINEFNKDLESMTFEEVINEFFAFKTGKSLNEKQVGVVKKVVERLGGGDED